VGEGVVQVLLCCDKAPLILCRACFNKAVGGKPIFKRVFAVGYNIFRNISQVEDELTAGVVVAVKNTIEDATLFRLDERVQKPEFDVLDVRLVEVDFCPDGGSDAGPVLPGIASEQTAVVKIGVVVIRSTLVGKIRDVENVLKEDPLWALIIWEYFFGIYAPHIMVLHVELRDIGWLVDALVAVEQVVDHVPRKLRSSVTRGQIAGNAAVRIELWVFCWRRSQFP